MVQKLKVQIALKEDPSFVPSTIFLHEVTTLCNSSSRGSNTNFWSLKALHSGTQFLSHAFTHIQHTYTHRFIQTIKNKNIKAKV